MRVNFLYYKYVKNLYPLSLLFSLSVSASSAFRMFSSFVRYREPQSAYLSRCVSTSFASSASRFNSSLPISRLCDSRMFDTASCNATIAR